MGTPFIAHIIDPTKPVKTKVTFPGFKDKIKPLPPVKEQEPGFHQHQPGRANIVPEK